MAGGRPRSAVWRNFDKIAGTKDVVYKKCSQLIPNAKVEKLDRHTLRNCDRWMAEEGGAFNLAAAQERRPKTNRVNLESTAARVEVDGRSSSCRTTSTRMTQADFNKLVADYIFSSGAALRTVEQPSFVQLVTESRPGLTVPSRALVAGSLLNTAYDDELEMLVDELKDHPFVAVTIDGCTAVKHEKKINFVLVTPNMKPKPWKVIATGSDSQTGEYIARLAIDVVREIDAAVGRFGFVTGAVTDNSKAMQAARTILERTRGCFAPGAGPAR